ncbi:hypothetical protein MRX96_007256 [Rhipicephalus microplus]
MDLLESCLHERSQGVRCLCPSAATAASTSSAEVKVSVTLASSESTQSRSYLSDSALSSPGMPMVFFERFRGHPLREIEF